MASQSAITDTRSRKPSVVAAVPVLRPRMLAAGYSDDELRRMRAGRQLVALRPGAYVAGGDERDLLDLALVAETVGELRQLARVLER